MAHEFDGAHRISMERERQVVEEGWTLEHDDEHCNSEMGIAGGCYAHHAATFPYMSNIQAYRTAPPPIDWPWDAKWWKPKQPQDDLAKAGALMAAEIDRLDRAMWARMDAEST